MKAIKSVLGVIFLFAVWSLNTPGCAHKKKEITNEIAAWLVDEFYCKKSYEVWGSIALFIIGLALVLFLLYKLCDSNKKTKSKCESPQLNDTLKKEDSAWTKRRASGNTAEFKGVSKELEDSAKDNKRRIAGLGDAALIIDGNNVVWHSDRYGWRVLKTLLDWIKGNGIDYHLYFDASIAKLEKKLDEKMDAVGTTFIKDQIDDVDHTTKCPSRDEADKFILHRADKTGGHIISNDGYWQWDARYPWIGTKNNTGEARRIHKFTVEGNMLSIPDLDIFEKIVEPQQRSANGKTSIDTRT